ncbi:hypothetical protein RvY_16535 [Ramazzottius varieornatus]|uniref:Uncharacterized protein n=1 Tax=Ramazzottius varieornatus TaxID=947166 RepID=A0A1D1W6B8_RAMVA|nr:hypothetical protein RvY_16535 [Ramazzottius varieornatus]
MERDNESSIAAEVNLEDHGIVKFGMHFETEAGQVDVICLEFSNQNMLFITQAPLVGTLIEAFPDDLVDIGTPVTYSTKTLFGADDVTLQLLARRLVEVLQKRLLLAISCQNLSMSTVRRIETEISRKVLDERRENQRSVF